MEANRDISQTDGNCPARDSFDEAVTVPVAVETNLWAAKGDSSSVVVPSQDIPDTDRSLSTNQPPSSKHKRNQF